jgi:ATP adenylyltransferase
MRKGSLLPSQRRCKPNHDGGIVLEYLEKTQQCQSSIEMQKLGSYNQLIEYLRSKSGLRMSHIYKPVMLLGVLSRGGTASKEDIATDFVLSDREQIAYYRTKVVHTMPGKRLVRDGLLSYDGMSYSAAGIFATLNEEQRQEVCEILQKRIDDYLGSFAYPFGDSNKDAVRGSVRYQILKEAGGRCELCGVSSREKQIDVDHIVPRSKGGSNDIQNLQALCRTCNANKRNSDDTDFKAVHQSYAETAPNCVFCNLDTNRIVGSNALAIAIRDGFPVTEHHTLIIPKRHFADYADATSAEVAAMNRLMKEQRRAIADMDQSVTGFNIGLNCGASAGQTIFHTHMHLIPRRDGDVAQPRGGVRHTIPGKGNY